MSRYDRIVKAVAKAVGIFSPAYARDYLRKHAQLRSYESGKTTGIDRNWRATSRTGNREIGPDWSRTTARARDLARNNPFAQYAIKNKVAYTVGCAIWPRPRVRLPDGTLDLVTNEMIEERWEQWAEACCADGRDWDDAKKLMFRHLETDGEGLIRYVATDAGPFLLELLEGDQIDANKDSLVVSEDGSRTIRGIEYDRNGRPRAYWLLTSHPGDWALPSYKSIRVPASQVIHLFDPGRITEGRGICRYAAAILPSYSHDQQRGAVMDLLRIAAAYGIFIKTDHPEDELIGAETENEEVGNEVTDSDGKPVKFVNPAGMHILGPGKSIETCKPDQPTSTYREFEQSHLRMVAAGFGMSYETFTGDLSNANYSIYRAGQINERLQFRSDSDLIIRKMATPVYRAWMDCEVLLNGMRLPNYAERRREFQRVSWSLPALPSNDPTKDEAADQAGLANGTTNRHIIAERKGLDYEDVVETLAHEEQDRRDRGLVVPASSAQPTAGNKPQEQSNADG